MNPFSSFYSGKFLVTNDRFDATENVGLSVGCGDLELELGRNLDERKDCSKSLPGKNGTGVKNGPKKISLVTRVPKIEF